MNDFNKARKRFVSVDLSSSFSVDSVIYISSCNDSAWSSDTENMIRRVETQVVSCSITAGKRRMTTASDEPGAGTSQPEEDSTPMSDERYFDVKMGHDPSKDLSMCAMKICRALIPAHERGPTVETPLTQSVSNSHTTSRIQNPMKT